MNINASFKNRYTPKLSCAQTIHFLPLGSKNMGTHFFQGPCTVINT